MFGRKIATLSPFLTPSETSAVANLEERSSTCP